MSMKKSTTISLLIGLFVFGAFSGILIQRYILSDENSDEISEEVQTCNESCRENGYTEGSCMYWSTSQSPEDFCAENGSSYLSGGHSDCAEQLAEINNGQFQGGVGIICCCK